MSFRKTILILTLLTTSTLLDLTCIELGIQRNFLVKSILVPTIIYHLPF